MAPRVFGVAVVQLNFWVNTRLASAMTDGSVTGVKWGLTMMLMPQAVIAQSVAMAALPTLSAQYALGKLDDIRSSLAASLRGILFLALPASLGLMLLRQPIVAMMLEYGKFDEQSTELISWALLWYAAGLVGHCLVEILARAFFALHNTKTPVLVGSVAMGLNIIFSLLFAAWFTRLGWMPHGGLALANSLATALEAAGLLILMRRRLNGLRGRYVLTGAAQALVATLVMSAGLWLWLAWAGDQATWLVAVGGVILGGLIYGLVILALGVSEARRLLSWLMRRLGR
jgi:putative peptidoglycan lipid II flippase